MLAIEPVHTAAALSVHGAYAEFVCLPHRELVPGTPLYGISGISIDYPHFYFFEEIRRLTGDGVDVVVDSIGRDTVVVYDVISPLTKRRLSGPAYAPEMAHAADITGFSRPACLLRQEFTIIPGPSTT